jgi:hypothetical protein
MKTIEILGGIPGQTMKVIGETKTHFIAVDAMGFEFTVNKTRALVVEAK